MGNALSVDLYELTMAQSYYRFRPRASATFDLFVRDLPSCRSFLVACGLEDAIGYITGLRFSASDTAYLETLKLFSREFLAFLRRFRFTGDVWAMPEGTVFFAGEPIIRVTAPVIQAQIIETALLNTVQFQTMIASKAARVVLAAQGRQVFDFSLRRTHGGQAGLNVARSSYSAGVSGTSNCLAGALYGIPVAGTMAHSFVMSFPRELDSFLAYSMSFPRTTTLLVDTYDTRRGIEQAITIGLYLRQKGYQLAGIRLDSGSLVSLSQMARRMLDSAGLRRTRIFASGDLDEYKITRMLNAGACIDSFGVGTNMGVSADAPSLDAIYKISEVTDDAGRFCPTMKLSRGKVSFPGRKQVFRRFDSRGRMAQDIVGLDSENIPAGSVLKRIISSGKLVYRLPGLSKIRAYVLRSLESLPDYAKRLNPDREYPVTVSPRLARLRQMLSKRLSRPV